ncbi:hypothetical protein BC830DRAFT_1088107 [Chytriomyces sp. MP71]|nr:hypothetical protein BC830DRAFT_1088107 [Chytriomyces sp. MP71]
MSSAPIPIPRSPVALGLAGTSPSGRSSPTKNLFSLVTQRHSLRSQSASRAASPTRDDTTTLNLLFAPADAFLPASALQTSEADPIVSASLQTLLMSASEEGEDEYAQQIMTMELAQMTSDGNLDAVRTFVDGEAHLILDGSSDPYSATAQLPSSLLCATDMQDDFVSPTETLFEEAINGLDHKVEELMFGSHESVAHALESMRLWQVDQLVRDSCPKQPIRKESLTTVADCEELRLLESFQARSESVADVITRLEEDIGYTNELDEEDDMISWMGKLWSNETTRLAASFGAIALAGLLVSAVVSTKRRPRR